ncbi:MAG: 3-isopropylmalate dehydratase small subunit [Candidatus Omnitrophica bacterium]|nr:3-isopropylmalate dehydratase small subunit [Candidatus Omnitrophota bacterium]
MKPFKSHRGLIAPLDRSNVDTDQIIPKQFLKSIRRTGFGESLFFDWRYLPDGKPNPDFELNKPEFKGAGILVARSNFGSGSSREHAVWAIHQYGFQVVIAESYADIFRNNSVKNGLLTVQLKAEEIEEIFQMAGRNKGLEATVDLDEQRVVLHLPEEIAFHFDVDAAVKEHLIHGLDETGLTLKQESEITAFEKHHNTQLTRR